ncbi:MAG: lactate racemase domain-containing protein [Pirellulales bacterium]
MPSVLRYGVEASLALDLPPEVLLSACAGQGRPSLADPAQAVAEALIEPLDFPPLARAMVPGDKIVLALEPGLPQAAVIVAEVVRHLADHGAGVEDITLLRTALDARSGDDPARGLDDARRRQINVLVHNPDDKRQLGLLATSRRGHAVYLNRAILDADLVVPIGCLRCEPATGYYGLYAGLFPSYSDAATIQRFARPAAPEKSARLSDDAAEAGWLLGIQFTIQVVPGEAGGLLAVLAGEAQRVYESGRRQCREAWSCSVPKRASLVVAAVAGGAGQQTWDNVARAAAAASRAVVEGGAIALCTELAIEPGAAMEQLADTDDLDTALKRIRREAEPDAMAATELALAREHAKLYLLSRLDESLVEHLGMAPVSQADDILRLAKRHPTCILLPDAQHAVATPSDDA